MVFVVYCEYDKKRDRIASIERGMREKARLAKRKLLKLVYAKWTINETMHLRCKKEHRF